MSVSGMRMHSAWDSRALEDVVKSSCVEAVAVTDRDGRAANPGQPSHALRRMSPGERA